MTSSNGRRFCAALLVRAALVAACWPAFAGTGASEAAEPPVPSLEQALAQAMESNPEITAAQAEVALAEAKLNGKRLEVARQVIALRNEWEAQKDLIGNTQAALKATETAYQRGETSQDSVLKARTALIEAEAKRARAETELRYLIGRGAPGGAKDASAARPRALRQEIRGAMAREAMTALNRPVVLEFTDTPMPDVVEYLSDHLRFQIKADEARITKLPLTLMLSKETLLAQALQAIEDQAKDVRFVVREYGILLTDRKHAEEQGFISAVEFWQESQPTGAAAGGVQASSNVGILPGPAKKTPKPASAQ